MDRDIIPREGRDNHQGKCSVPIKDPNIKKIRVINIRVFPPPTVNKVPEPHPPPSCIPKPNKKDPTRTEIPIGPKAPTITLPNALLLFNKGIINKIAKAIASSCERIPFPCLETMNFRQAPVKPKAAW